MKIIIRSLVALLLLAGTSAFITLPKWDHGTIQLKEGQVFSGKVYYEQDQNQILYLAGHTIQEYPASLIDYFEIPGKEFGEGRKYYSLPSTNLDSNPEYQFYEVLAEGRLILLYREKEVNHRSIKKGPVYHVNQFSIIDVDGSIHYLKSSKNSLYKMMKDQEHHVHEYIKTRNLNLQSKADLKEVLEFYNYLHTSN